MVKKAEIFDEIITELKLSITSKNISFEVDGKYELPRLISIGDAGSIQITTKLDMLISKLARRYQHDNKIIRELFKLEEWITSVRQMVGLEFGKLDFGQDDLVLARNLQDQIDDFVKSRETSTHDNREYFFGINLFRTDTTSAFAVGPVQFEKKSIWLERQVGNQVISTTTSNRIKQSWDRQKLVEIPTSRESRSEEDILGVSKNYDWICSVPVVGFGSRAGLERAVRAIHLSLLTLALRWNIPSQILDGFSFSLEAPLFLKITGIARVKTGVTSIRSHSKTAFGAYFPSDDWKQYLVNYKELIEVSAEINNFILNAADNNQRAEILKCLSIAMTWFSAACAEEDDLISITKFAACLDTLSSGKGKDAILKLLEFQLGIKRDDKIHVDGYSASEIISQIYHSSRSHFLHGNHPSPFRDESDTRKNAEFLSRECLVYCLLMTGEDDKLVDPKMFLKRGIKSRA